MILTPKDDFLKSTDAKILADLVAAKWFTHALTIALAQMQMEMGNADSPAKGWDSFSQLCGARRFISTLLNLPDSKVIEKPKSTSELNYRA